jgi:hypothetical protein
MVTLGINLVEFREHNVMVIQASTLLASKKMRMIVGREISNVGRNPSQSFHNIMSLQCLYVLKDSEESMQAKLTIRHKFTRCKE